MKTFQPRTARRIATVCILLAAITSPIAWFIERENAEEATVALAMEESRRLLSQYPQAFSSDPHIALEFAQAAADALTGGMFDIAELYDYRGVKVAESLTDKGAVIEELIPSHGRPSYLNAFYESLELPDRQWVLRIFIPLTASRESSRTSPSGYFEGVRVIPEWQHQQMLTGAMTSAAMVALAALLCGVALYPVVVHLTTENRQKARDILKAHLSMMEALGRAIAKRDSDTGAHNYRVAWISAKIAAKLDITGLQMQSLILGSFLHDVGKIGIPDAILLKPGRLDADELNIMRTHVQQGEDIIGTIDALHGANDVVSCHHEKWDGSGYPRGLSGENIPLAARIFAIADVFDALTSRRPYKPPMVFEEVMEILKRDTGTHFDPKVMAVFEPMAVQINEQLSGANESECQILLDATLEKYFQVDF